MRRILLAIAITMLLVPNALAQPFSTKQATRWQGEPAPIFRAQEVLPAELLQGPDYVIGQDVPVRDYKYLFTIRTSYGDIPALGMNMLEQRLREMYSINYARKLIDDPQFVKGIFETVKQLPEGAKVIITNPGGTILRAPKGIERMASNLLNPQNQRAGSEERRKFAIQIGCDPETTNPVLVRMLDNLSLRKGLGKTGSNVGVNLVLPGLGLLSTTKDFRDELVRKTPAEINDKLEKELLAMRVWEPVAKSFCRERSFTTLQRMIFVDHLRALKSVENYQLLAYRATTAYNEAEGLGMLNEIRLLHELHDRHGIAQINTQGLPIAVLSDGRVVIINASDYIHDTQEWRDAITAFRRSRPNDPTALLTAGRVSPRAKEALTQHGVHVIESGRVDLTPRISRQPGER